jgi:hypothetical protein
VALCRNISVYVYENAIIWLFFSELGAEQQYPGCMMAVLNCKLGGVQKSKTGMTLDVGITFEYKDKLLHLTCRGKLQRVKIFT